MDRQKMEQAIQKLTAEERHDLFVILRRYHLRDCMAKRRQKETKGTHG